MRLYSVSIQPLIGIDTSTEIEMRIAIETSNGIQKSVGIGARSKTMTLNRIECQNQYSSSNVPYVKTRIFKVSVCSVSSNKLHPFGPESLIRWKLMHARSFLIPVHAALTVRSAGNAISPSSTFCFPTVIHVGLFVSLHPTLRHKLLSRGICLRDLNAIFCGKIA